MRKGSSTALVLLAKSLKNIGQDSSKMVSGSLHKIKKSVYKSSQMFFSKIKKAIIKVLKNQQKENTRSYCSAATPHYAKCLPMTTE